MFWYSKIVPKIVIKNAVADVAVKVALEFFFYTFFINSLYLLIIPLLALKTIKEAKNNYNLHLKKAIMKSWTFWPFCNIINYSLVPNKYRVPYV